MIIIFNIKFDKKNIYDKIYSMNKTLKTFFLINSLFLISIKAPNEERVASRKQKVRNNFSDYIWKFGFTRTGNKYDLYQKNSKFETKMKEDLSESLLGTVLNDILKDIDKNIPDNAVKISEIKSKRYYVLNIFYHVLYIMFENTGFLEEIKGAKNVNELENIIGILEFRLERSFQSFYNNDHSEYNLSVAKISCLRKMIEIVKGNTLYVVNQQKIGYMGSKSFMTSILEQTGPQKISEIFQKIELTKQEKLLRSFIIYFAQDQEILRQLTEKGIDIKDLLRMNEESFARYEESQKPIREELQAEMNRLSELNKQLQREIDDKKRELSDINYDHYRMRLNGRSYTEEEKALFIRQKSIQEQLNELQRNLQNVQQKFHLTLKEFCARETGNLLLGFKE